MEVYLKVATLLIALGGLLLGAHNYFDQRSMRDQQEKLTQSIAQSKLDKAWDLLGGRPLSDFVVDDSWNENPDDIRAANDLIRDVKSTCPELLAQCLRLLWELDCKDEALAAFESAIALDPYDTQALNNRGVLLRQSGKLAEAIDAYSRVLALDPQNADTGHNRASAMLESGRHAEALAAYETLLALQARDTWAHFGRGNALLALGRGEDALATYDAAIAIDAQFALAHRGRGIVLEKLGRGAEADAAHQRSRELDPSLPARE